MPSKRAAAANFPGTDIITAKLLEHPLGDVRMEIAELSSQICGIYKPTWSSYSMHVFLIRNMPAIPAPSLSAHLMSIYPNYTQYTKEGQSFALNYSLKTAGTWDCTMA